MYQRITESLLAGMKKTLITRITPVIARSTRLAAAGGLVAAAWAAGVFTTSAHAYTIDPCSYSVCRADLVVSNVYGVYVPVKNIGRGPAGSSVLGKVSAGRLSVFSVPALGAGATYQVRTATQC